jgi:c-di-GMP-related signal transduction protein
LIRPLQLSEVLVAAIIDHQGNIGRLLQLHKRTDLRDATGSIALLAELQLTPVQITVASLTAHQWMLGITREVKGGAHD